VTNKSRQMKYKIAPPGELIDIGTHRLHAQIIGEENSDLPVVVFEPALGAFGLQWFRIQGEISKRTRTISYDRAGQGWSDFSPHPRTPEQLTTELKQLVTKLDIKTPFILVAHSFGGLVSRYYAKEYPDDVAGLVLVDTSHIMQYEKITGFDKLRKNMGLMLNILSGISNVGFIGRSFARMSLKESRPHIPDDVWEKLVYVAGLPKHHQTVKLEFGDFERFFGEKSEIPDDFGNLPLKILVAGDSILNQRPIGGFTAEELNQMHHEAQKEMAQMSTNSQHIIVPSATHFSIVSHPDHAQYVIDSIQDLLKITDQ